METRVEYQIAGQFDLFGGLQPPPDLDRDAKVAYILERWPECRDDDRELWLRFWQVFDGMEQALGTKGMAQFRRFFLKATHPETIRRGRQEVQRVRTDSGSLRPSPEETKRRQELDGADPFGRKR